MGVLEFEPILKRARWGGRKLATLLGKSIGSQFDYAESWEISDVPGCESRVCFGEHTGKSLRQLWQESASELSGRLSNNERFPLLVKFLDANDRLSVQVHPNDKLAQQRYCSPFGKTECWTILHSEPAAKLYVGLQPGVDRAELEQAVRDNRIEGCLHEIDVKPGDFVFVPAGIVHAIGEGIVLAEIQQTSDTTFRLFDWNRLGADGEPRALHIENALDCIDFQRGPVFPTATRIVQTPFGSVEDLVSCEHFQVRRFCLSEVYEPPPEGIMRIWILLSGSAIMKNENGERNLPTGRTILAAAASKQYSLCPQDNPQLLEVTLPRG